MHTEQNFTHISSILKWSFHPKGARILENFQLAQVLRLLNMHEEISFEWSHHTGFPVQKLY